MLPARGILLVYVQKKNLIGAQSLLRHVMGKTMNCTHNSNK